MRATAQRVGHAIHFRGPRFFESEPSKFGQRTASERLVVSAFIEALNREDIGIRDNFFDLGGHSMMAARVMAQLRRAGGVDITLRNLFERPTPEELAAAIDALKWKASARPATDHSGDREDIDL